MSFPKIQDARQLNDEQLSERILEIKKNLASLRVLKATGRMEKPHEFKHAKHELAQLLTVEGERNRKAEAEKAAASTPEVPSTPEPEPEVPTDSSEE
ncbi:MAG: 50S ribosomal protein L29 [Cyanobacteria bacterium J06592_8]